MLARIRCPNLTAGRHPIRAALPVPPGFTGPVHLRDSRGTAWPTQVEVVSRYPDGSPRTVEVIALADTQAGPQTFDLAAGAGPAAPALGGKAPTLRVVDHMGTAYASQPQTSDYHRKGAVLSTLHQAGPMSSGVADMLGFKMWTSFIAGEDVQLVELVVHNGFTTNPLAGDAYFRDLRVVVPAGYVVTHLWPEQWADAGGTLIRAAADGTMHVLLMKQRREFRFAIHRPEDAAKARALLEMHGFGVCVPGDGLWSWQSVPGFLPYATTVVGLHAEPINWETHPYGLNRPAIYGALLAGSPLPDSQGGNQGSLGSPYHPYFWGDGNGASGAMVWQIDGMAILTTGRADKLHEAMAVHRCLTDRHHVGIYAANGTVHKAESTTGNWKVTAYPGLMWGGMEGQLHYKAASQWRRDQVAAQGKLPPYEGYLRGFSVFDFAHLGRRITCSMALAWLCNDPIARHELEVNAEWSRMYGFEAGNGDLAAAWAKSKQYPGRGGFGGRIEGWAGICIDAAYQLSSDPRRKDRMAAWHETQIDQLVRAQLPSGGWLAHEGGKPTDGFGDQAVSQSFEVGIHSGHVRALWASTGDPRIPPMLLRLAQAHGIKNGSPLFHWLKGWGGPQTRIAVRSKDPALPAFASPQASPVPLAADNWQTASLLHWGLDVNQTDPLILAAVHDMLGADPLATLKAKPLDRLDNRAGLWRFLQGGVVVPPPVDPPPPTRPPPTEPPPTRPPPRSIRTLSAEMIRRLRLAYAAMRGGQ